MSQYYIDQLAKISLQLMRQEEEMQRIKDFLGKVQALINKYKEEDPDYATKYQSPIE